MIQQETIYNLVPQEVFVPKKEKLFISQYPKDLKPTATTFGILCTSYPGSANYGGSYQHPRGAHPTESVSKTFGRPNGNNIYNIINPNFLYQASTGTTL
jgi:hypothetical protein